jgi:hypothetical protein
MLVTVEERCPALLPMAAWAYGEHSHLIAHHSPRTVVSLQSGVLQGVPLGSLLFALALQGSLAAGAPIAIGTPAFRTATAKSCATHACHLIYDILALPLVEQDR